MKAFKYFIFSIAILTSFMLPAQVAITPDGSSADSSAMLEIKSTEKGFLPPRMTQVHIGAIADPADGLMVFNSDDGKLYIYLLDGNTWKEVAYGTGTIAGPFICGESFVDDRDSITYSTVLIGTQCWMAENLAYLPSVVGVATGSTSIAYYYVYGYDGTDVPTAKATTNYQTYGVLYNWPAALTACPENWHLPTDDEWTTLTTYLGGLNDAGGKMKETGTTHWNEPNNGATNESGFTGLPGGARFNNPNFANLGRFGYWWSSTTNEYLEPWSRFLFHEVAYVTRNNYVKDFGFSVRCVMD